MTDANTEPLNEESLYENGNEGPFTEREGYLLKIIVDNWPDGQHVRLLRKSLATITALREEIKTIKETGARGLTDTPSSEP